MAVTNFNESVSPEEAIQRLLQGNARFTEREHTLADAGWRPGLAKGQKPFAVILGCSDSRAPAELVFDQGLGDLFVIRIAGNIVAPSGIGSVEYAISQLGTRLVVVMGHTHCGAVQATLNGIQQGEKDDSRHIRSITDRIRPHVQELALAGLPQESLMKAAVKANVRASVAHLRNASSVIEDYGRSGTVAIAGAVYDLDSGRVEFIENPVAQK